MSVLMNVKVAAKDGSDLIDALRFRRTSTEMMSILLIILFNLLYGPELLSKCSARDSLTVRNGHAMAYDPDQALVMLFGGADDHQVLGDLWAWNGERWHCLSDGGPPPRTFPALAYDCARKRLVLYGGNRVLFGTAEDTTTFLNDMWAWDGQAWYQIHTTTPSARAEASIAYDSDRKYMVLFGGYRNENGKRIRLGDTWEWDGRRWVQKSAYGPAPRNGTSMAYDTHRKRTVLFGGSGASGETWEWDGKDWERILSAETEGRFNSAMAYDAKRQVLVRFGGWTGKERVGDTWRYDGSHWTRVTHNGPAARNHTSMTYDNQRELIVLFGGHDGDRVFGDTWEWNGSSWSQRTERAPRLRVNNGH